VLLEDVLFSDVELLLEVLLEDVLFSDVELVVEFADDVLELLASEELELTS